MENFLLEVLGGIRAAQEAAGDLAAREHRMRDLGIATLEDLSLIFGKNPASLRGLLAGIEPRPLPGTQRPRYYQVAEVKARLAGPPQGEVVYFRGQVADLSQKRKKPTSVK